MTIITEKKRRSGRAARFPTRLHDLMNFAEATGLESIISWELNGHGIKINHPGMLVEQILPLFFDQTKYRSFRRQLNMWHFHRITEGPNKGVFVHPYFVKDNQALCGLMSRHVEPKLAIDFPTRSISPDTTCTPQALVLSDEPLDLKALLDIPLHPILPVVECTSEALMLSKEPLGLY